MSMDFSEFKRRIGAEPHSRDPAVLAALASGPEFEQAAAEAERFEARLELALAVPVPGDLVEELDALALARRGRNARSLPLALAASLLVAAGAASLMWRTNHSWNSVEDYVVQHYRHDGGVLLSRADGGTSADVQAMLADFRVQAAPELVQRVDVIKVCPTPDGNGIHMVLKGANGPFTVIYMPGTAVKDRESLAFDGMEAMLVQLSGGSAVIIGSQQQHIPEMYTLVRDAIRPLSGDPLSNNS
jgi:hypothetical protein